MNEEGTKIRPSFFFSPFPDGHSQLFDFGLLEKWEVQGQNIFSPPPLYAVLSKLSGPCKKATSLPACYLHPLCGIP